MSELWRCLEGLHGLEALPAVWHRHLGPEFPWVQEELLKNTKRLAGSYPSTHVCGCNLRVMPRGGDMFAGLSRCGLTGCKDVELQRKDLTLWEVNWRKLGPALANAFACREFDEDLGIPGARQIAAFGGASLPVVLVIHHSQRTFEGALSKLVARLKERFIVLAPTGDFLSAQCHGFLKSANAGFFDLESLVTVTAARTLRASKSGEQLFSRLLPDQASRSDQREHGGGAALLPSARYLLRRGTGVWRVVFDGKEGEIDEGRGISLAAYLLFNPPVGGLHGTELAALVFGQTVVQEASLGSDGDSTRLLIKKQAKDCMAALQNPSSSEMVKEEAMERLEQLAKALNVTRADSEGGAGKQVRAVRRAIHRLIEKLCEAKDRKNDPHPALRAFGEHLYEYLRKPSSRFAGDRRARTRAEVAGRFTYERPNGVVWAE